MEDHYPNEKIVLMQSFKTNQLWHETTGPSIFKFPRKYEVIDSAGQLANKGFVVCDHLPVSDEGRPVFEYEFKNHAALYENLPGFIALRVLRPLSSETYIIMTMWEKESSYETWKDTKAYETAQHKKPSTSHLTVFSGPTYVSTFHVDEEELEDLGEKE